MHIYLLEHNETTCADLCIAESIKILLEKKILPRLKLISINPYSESDFVYVLNHPERQYEVFKYITSFLVLLAFQFSRTYQFLFFFFRNKV